MPKEVFIGGQFYELDPNTDSIQIGDWCYEPENSELFQAGKLEQIEFPYDGSLTTMAIIDKKGVIHHTGTDPWHIHKIVGYGS